MVSGDSISIPSPALSTARTWPHRIPRKEGVTVSIGDPQDKSSNPAGEADNVEEPLVIAEGREYQRPQIHPRDEETEGDFWCD